MKLTIAILVLATIASVRSQETVNPPTPAPPPVPAVPPRDLRIPLPHEIIHESVRRAMQMAQRAVAGTSAAVASGLPGTSGTPAGAEPVTVELQNVQRNYNTAISSSRPSRTLIVLSDETDATKIANAEEDLAIMARILDKAARSNPDDGRRFASGIEVDGAVFGSSSGARNIILQNYGALFLLSVRYPLIAPPEKPAESKTKDNSSDDWKRAREEIQGSARADVWTDPSWHSRTPVEDFDADKVEQLKASLLEALKNATHIRALKPDDYITVVVQGADAGRTEVIREVGKPARINSKEREAGRAGSGGGGGAGGGGGGGGAAGAVYSVNANAMIRRTSSQGQSVMTIRVKKSDADAYAQDKLSAEEFRKKAAIQTYFRKPDASNSANSFMQIVR